MILYRFSSLQVRVRERNRCTPLTEDIFRRAIESNYYSDAGFEFDLDHVQTNELIRLFMAVREGGVDEGEGWGGGLADLGLAQADGYVVEYPPGFSPGRRVEDIRPDSIPPPSKIVDGEEEWEVKDIRNIWGEPGEQAYGTCVVSIRHSVEGSIISGRYADEKE